MQTMNNAKVAVIIPVYNETEVIGEVIVEVLKHFKHVICVDDGSIDNSADEISKTKATLVKHPFNLGQGAALQTGIEYALIDETIEYFVTYDADGQHDLSDVMFMLRTIKETGVDIVLGSRFLGKAEDITWLKRRILKLAIKFSNKTSGIKLTDAHNGLRVFNRKVAEQLNITMSDFAHASEIVERIAQNKFTYQEVPVTILYTDYSRKKGQSIINAVNISFDILLNKVTKL
jgi:glycosyltransferase involved in cell wall biosynthesis